MKALIERLRDMQGKRYNSDWGWWVQQQCSKAADALESQATEIERLECDLAAARRIIDDEANDSAQVILERDELRTEVGKQNTLIAEQNRLAKERQEWALKNNETIRELRALASRLGEGLIRTRQSLFPHVDQKEVLYRDFPLLAAIDAAMQKGEK